MECGVVELDLIGCALGVAYILAYVTFEAGDVGEPFLFQEFEAQLRQRNLLELDAKSSYFDTSSAQCVSLENAGMMLGESSGLRGPSSRSRLLSRLRMRFRGMRRSKQCEQERYMDNDSRPHLEPIPLPLVLSEHRHLLSQLGWTILTIPQPSSSPALAAYSPQSLHPLQEASKSLLKASAAFFDLPVEEKAKWKTRLGSEEGWSQIPGEKEFITLRTLSYTPDILKDPAKKYWDLMGTHLDACLGRISSSLRLPDGETDGLRRYVGPCKRMGDAEGDKTATMLRLFRYEGWEKKTVAEPHADLGLLSCVVGNVPGLEVWDGMEYIAIEKDYTTPCATLLGGRQLERLTNYRYPAGGHQVVSYGQPNMPRDDPSNFPTHRFSIVFVLRAHGNTAPFHTL